MTEKSDLPTSRGPRRSSEQIRDLLVDAGLAIVASEGLANGAEHLTFKRVFSYLKESKGVTLSHASVIKRVFDSQEDFQTEVLKSIATNGAADLSGGSLSLFAEAMDNADFSSVEIRTDCLLNLVRVAGNFASEALRTSELWKAWIGVWALSASGNRSASRKEIHDALRETYAEIDQSAINFYNHALELLGFQFRNGYTIEMFTIAASSIVEGCSLRDLVDPDAMKLIDLPTGPDGSLQSWTPQSMALAAITQAVIEPIPDWVAPKP
ncbi:MAG: hypothetical protein WCL38_02905 [Actinomycetota bacterium]